MLLNFNFLYSSNVIRLLPIIEHCLYNSNHVCDNINKRCFQPTCRRKGWILLFRGCCILGKSTFWSFLYILNLRLWKSAEQITNETFFTQLGISSNFRNIVYMIRSPVFSETLYMWSVHLLWRWRGNVESCSTSLWMAVIKLNTSSSMICYYFGTFSSFCLNPPILRERGWKYLIIVFQVDLIWTRNKMRMAQLQLKYKCCAAYFTVSVIHLSNMERKS